MKWLHPRFNSTGRVACRPAFSWTPNGWGIMFEICSHKLDYQKEFLWFMEDYYETD